MVVTSVGSGRNLDEMTVPDVHLWTGGGIAVALDTKDVYLAAGHFVGFTDYRRPIWQNDIICIYGSSQFMNAMTELGNGLLENLERALEAFTETCAMVRPHHVSPRPPE
jgi:hypothetical protein